MQKEQFESQVRSLLPEVTDSAMNAWTQYTQELDQEEVELQDVFFDASYVELSLIKQHQGEEVATQLFNYGEQFTFNYFELRGAAAKLLNGWSLEEISQYAIEYGCDPTLEEHEESRAALQTFRQNEQESAGMQMI